MNPQQRNLRRVLAALIGIVALTAVACGGSNGDQSGGGSSDGGSGGDSGGGSATSKVDTSKVPAITIGIQDFGESKVLANVYGGALSAAGYKVEYKDLGGYREIVYSSFKSGDINFTADYAASALEFLNQGKGEASADEAATAEKLRTYLGQINLQALAPAPAQDRNTFVVTKETADKGVTSINNLTPELRLGGPQDCPTNPFCIPALLQSYEVDMRNSFKPLDGGGPITKDALRGGQIDVAVLFSTDASIAAEGWVELTDPNKILAAENVVPVLTKDLAAKGGESLQTIVDRVSKEITTERLLEMNKSFDIDKEDADAVAETFLKEHGLN